MVSTQERRQKFQEYKEAMNKINKYIISFLKLIKKEKKKKTVHERHCETRTMPKLRRILAAVEILFSFPPHRFSKMCEPSNRRVQAHQGKKLAKYFPLRAFQCGKQT